MKRIAAASFSIGVLGVVGVLTIGMTAAPEAVAAANRSVDSSSTGDVQVVSVRSIMAHEAQSYTAPTSAQLTALQRSDYSAASVVAAGVPSASTKSGAPAEGGLTLAQAQDLIAEYVSTADTAPLRKGEAVLDGLYPGSEGPGDCGSGGTVDKLDNCVGFVTYFMNVYTSFNRYVIANGGQEAANMAAVLQRKTSSSPSVYSVGSSWGTSADGHTFVVLGIHGDQAIVGEAACGLTDGWPRARAVSVSSLQGDTFVDVSDLILPQQRTLAQLLG
ncbi:hypothetical protein ABCS02_22905 [Microbacterium sp. X-17]|uniref:hypothetical protein n=1 Tax=Microbacterium sp. X-17 TaxID=3144404 RepID=UPI0031F50C29